jgi:hypothetical protein
MPNTLIQTLITHPHAPPPSLRELQHHSERFNAPVIRQDGQGQGCSTPPPPPAITTQQGSVPPPSVCMSV